MLRSQYAILAEHFRIGQSGTFDLLGVFDRIFAGGIPAQHRQMVLVVLLVASSEDNLGPHEFVLQWTAPSGKLLAEQRSTFVVKPEAGTWLGSARLIFEFQNLVLPEVGKYRFRIQVDGVEVAEHVLSVALKNAK